MATALTRKELSHRRIVDAAARAIRRDGFAGVGVAEVMKDAGLTHGGFYAHFDSRDALLVAALDEAGRVSARAIAERRGSRGVGEVRTGVRAIRALVEGYLADTLVDATDAGCPVAALCAEMPRQSPPVRKASAIRVRALLRYVGEALGPGVPAAEAGVVAATMVGALQMARSLGGAEGRTLLAAARGALLERYDRT